MRASGLDRVLDLARRLAEEFHDVPLPMVSRAVRTAADAAEAVGGDLVAALPTIERVARENLAALRTVTVDLTGEIASV